MARVVDNLIAYRILSMLVTPFKDTKAYELGIIDEKGKVLKKAYELRTSAEKESYNYLHRLVFNMKRIINKLPGGESKLRNIVAAYFLIKETYASGSKSLYLEHKFDDLINLLDNNNITLAEEEITVEKYLKMVDEVSGAPANATGAAVSTDVPVIKPKKKKPYDGRTREAKAFVERINSLRAKKNKFK